MSDTFNHEADAWDSLLFNEDDLDEDVPAYRYPKSNKTCKICGKSGLSWRFSLRKNKWILFDSHTLIDHTCPDKDGTWRNI